MPAAPQQANGIRQRYLRGLRTLGVLALLALLLTPFIFDPGARDDAFFTPKWAWMAIWTALGLGALVARALSGRALQFLFNDVWMGAAAFAFWNWASILWARSESLASEKAAQITWLTLALWLGMQVLQKWRVLLWMARLWVAAGVITALWVLLEDAVHAWFPQFAWIQPNLADWRGYLAAGLGNTNHIGDLLALTLLPALVLFGEARSRKAQFALFGALLILPAGLIVCVSLGSTIGLILGATLMLLMALQRTGGRWFLRRWRRWALLLALWAGLIAFFVLDHPANPHRPGIIRQATASERLWAGGPTRLAIWAQGLEMVRQHSLLGVGAGNFPYVFPEMDTKLIWDRPDLRVYQGSFTNAAHNEILQTWSELGIVGLFLLLALVSLAFYSLFKDLLYTNQSSFLARMTLAGLLAAWVAQAQMNFTLQHPVGALSFYAILLGVVVEKLTRAKSSAMPPLSQEIGILSLQVNWRTMSRATGIGLAFVLPRPLALTLGGLVILGVLCWAPLRWRPVLAQREYRRAVQAPDPRQAEAHFQRALKLNPNETGCRSRYSAWLIEQRRPADALRELKLVRQRLNSNELWQRQAMAEQMLGNHAAAEEALKTYYQRVWRIRSR